MPTDFATSYDPPRRMLDRDTKESAKESVISAELTIEGKIEGAGHVRIAGRFKGDVQVQGNLTIEIGAKVTGSVRANTIIIGGELEGNIDDAVRVELLESGVLNGNLKAGSLTVAAGSRMRGQVEFGWEEKGLRKVGVPVESVSAL
jgi:cytoskeletal protein CcmA (bactofilin family)